MILGDTNFWLALSLSGHILHRAARDWFAAQRARSGVLFCRATQQSFLRLLTTEAVTRPYGIPPLTNRGAWKVYDGLTADSRIGWAAEPAGDAVGARWKSYASRDTASPKLWMDAYLAAVAVAGGHQLVTTDSAFRHFKELSAIILSAAKSKS